MPVRYERDGDLAVITLDFPPLNLIGPDLQSGIHDAIDQAEADGARAVLLCADGPSFSAGAQVQGFQGDRDGRPRASRGSAFARLEAIEVPVVAAVQGNCLAGGFELALSCDLIFAARDARIGLVETTIGLFPLAGGVPRLVQRVGATRAKDIIFTGGRHTAEQMLAWGLINRVCEPETLRAEATEHARRLAAGPTLAYKVIKKLAAATVADGIPAADALTPEASAAIMKTEDVQNGVKSLLANGPGKAVFHGR